MPKITVIVPVYKVEKYLSACVDSILAQTFEDFELILVEDGSPDNCGVLCDNYAKEDSRIKVIHQENQGLSGARNAGMDRAEGEYIAFVDSDDIVTKEFLEKLYKTIRNENADIACCKFYEFEENEKEFLSNTKEGKVEKKEIFDNRNACMEIYKGNSMMTVNACAKLFCANIILKHRFPIKRLHEDQAVIPIICYESKKIVSLTSKMYCYRGRSDSITREKFTIRRYDDLWAIEKCIKYFENHNEIEIVKQAKKKRERLICTYAIYAKKDGVIVPKQYKKNVWKALWYLRNNVSDEKYSYYLGQVNMNLVLINEYWKKIKKYIKKGIKIKIWI